jgi:hypothetical protein
MHGLACTHTYTPTCLVGHAKDRHSCPATHLNTRTEAAPAALSSTTVLSTGTYVLCTHCHASLFWERPLRPETVACCQGGAQPVHPSTTHMGALHIGPISHLPLPTRPHLLPLFLLRAKRAELWGMCTNVGAWYVATVLPQYFHSTAMLRQYLAAA